MLNGDGFSYRVTAHRIYNDSEVDIHFALKMSEAPIRNFLPFRRHIPHWSVTRKDGELRELLSQLPCEPAVAEVFSRVMGGETCEIKIIPDGSPESAELINRLHLGGTRTF